MRSEEKLTEKNRGPDDIVEQMFDDCSPLGRDPYWKCKESFIVQVGEYAINAERFREKHKNAVNFFDQDRNLLMEKNDAELSKWYRQWWIMLPAGALVGGLITALTLTLAK